MNIIRSIIRFIAASIIMGMFLISLYISFIKHPEFTGRELLIEYWWFYLIEIILFFIIGSFLFNSENTNNNFDYWNQ